jgi:hypothetical protein
MSTALWEQSLSAESFNPPAESTAPAGEVLSYSNCLK